jgi:hypothetical protein
MPCLNPALSTPLATQAHPLPVSACSCCSLNYTNIAPSLRKTAAGDTCATPSRTTVTECLGVKWISDAPTKCRTLADVAGVCDNGKVSRVLRMPDCCVLAVASVHRPAGNLSGRKCLQLQITLPPRTPLLQCYAVYNTQEAIEELEARSSTACICLPVGACLPASCLMHPKAPARLP